MLLLLPPTLAAHATPGRTPPVELGTKRSHHLGYVPHQIILELAIFHHQNASPPSSQRSFHILEAEPAQALPMLHHDRAHRMVRHQTPQTATVAIQTGTDLLYDFVGSVALLRCPFDDPPDLPVQVFLLVGRRHTSVYHKAPVVLRRHDHVVASIGQLLDLKLGR